MDGPREIGHPGYVVNLTLASTGLLAGLGPVLLLLTPARQGHGRGAPVDPAETFRSRCSTCHAVPDPAFDSDRAWLGRIPETA